uniref:Uncharacterized protein n=1 Tax=Scleropages formosus TaxID=113540 RepID=A0A8C9SCS1_SCLFO
MVCQYVNYTSSLVPELFLDTLLFPSQAESGEPSASAEGAVANGGVMANGLNPGVLSSIILNGQAQLAQVCPWTAVVVQPPGVAIGQVAVPLVANGALQQGGALPVAPSLLGFPQLQPANGGAPLLAILPQGNMVGGMQTPAMNPSQTVQVVLGTWYPIGFVVDGGSMLLMLLTCFSHLLLWVQIWPEHCLCSFDRFSHILVKWQH